MDITAGAARLAELAAYLREMAPVARAVQERRVAESRDVGGVSSTPSPYADPAEGIRKLREALGPGPSEGALAALAQLEALAAPSRAGASPAAPGGALGPVTPAEAAAALAALASSPPPAQAQAVTPGAAAAALPGAASPPPPPPLYDRGAVAAAACPPQPPPAPPPGRPVAPVEIPDAPPAGGDTPPPDVPEDPEEAAAAVADAVMAAAQGSPCAAAALRAAERSAAAAAVIAEESEREGLLKKEAGYAEVEAGYHSVLRSWYEDRVAEAARLWAAAAAAPPQERPALEGLARDAAGFTGERDPGGKLRRAVREWSEELDVEERGAAPGVIRRDAGRAPGGEVGRFPEDLRAIISAAGDDMRVRIDERTREHESRLAQAVAAARAAGRDAAALLLAQGALGAAGEVRSGDAAASARLAAAAAALEECRARRRAAEEDAAGAGDELRRAMAELGCSGPDPTGDPSAADPAGEPGGDPEYTGTPDSDPAKAPDITTRKWWLKFCGLASLVNLVPLFWPVGLIIPFPGGIIRVPFPIVWAPLAVIPTPAALVVVLLGQCGIVPSPFVFVLPLGPAPVGPAAPRESWFIAAIRPLKRIKPDTGGKVLGAAPVLQGPFGPFDADPELTRSLPMAQDDLPPWDRLTLENPLLILYLIDWCSAGRKGGGLMEFWP